jgi:integrase
MAKKASAPEKKADLWKRVGPNIWKRGGRYYVAVTIDGRWVRKSAGRTRNAAQALLVQLRQEDDRGAAGLSRRPKTTLAEFAPVYLRDWADTRKRSAERDHRSCKVLVTHLGDRRLKDLTLPVVEQYMRDRLQSIKAASVNREVACLRKMLNFAVSMKYLSANPIGRIELYKEARRPPTRLSPKDELKLLELSPPWLRRMIRFALAHGCRQGEILALTWSDVAFNNDGTGGAFTIREAKSGEGRVVALHPRIATELWTRKGASDQCVFTLDSGRSPTRNSVSSAFRRIATEAGLPAGFTFHALRHEALSRMGDAGYGPHDIMAVSGHKTLSMVLRYLHSEKDRRRAMVAAVPVPEVPATARTKQRVSRPTAVEPPSPSPGKTVVLRKRKPGQGLAPRTTRAKGAT